MHMRNIIKKIYLNPVYTIFIVLCALISLFADIPNYASQIIFSLFIVDLCIATAYFVLFSEQKNLKLYFKIHIPDIISCIPFDFMGVFKTFRFIRLTRLSRLSKVSRITNMKNEYRFQDLFKAQTAKELATYISIYLIGNVYIFKEIEGSSVIDSVYWVMTTTSTVGYGDFVPTHTITKILAILLMILGVAIMGYINGFIINMIVNKSKRH